MMSPRNATSTIIASVPSAPTLPAERITSWPASITRPSCQRRRSASRTLTGSDRTRRSTALSPNANRGSIADCSFTIRFTSGCTRSPGLDSRFSKITCPDASPPKGSPSGSRAPDRSTLINPCVCVDWPISGTSQLIQRSHICCVRTTRSRQRPGGTISSPGAGRSRSHGAPRRRPPEAARSNGPSASWPSKNRTGISPGANWKPATSAAVHAAEVSIENARNRSERSGAERAAMGLGSGSATRASFSAWVPRADDNQSSGSGSDCSAFSAAAVAPTTSCPSGPRSENGLAPAPASLSLPPVQGVSSRDTCSQS